MINKWQPIETAPEDGTKFLAYVEKVGCKDNKPKIMITSINDELYEGLMFFHDPTHWIPLPEPPQETKKDAK